MKKFKRFLIVLGMCLSAVCFAVGLTACDFVIGNKNGNSAGLKYTLSKDGTCYICSGMGTCTDNEIVIEKEYKNLPVREIGTEAFSGCIGLTSVTIPDSVTSIGVRAFFDCSRLTNITIPNSVTIIGWHAFQKCSGLTNVTISDSVTNLGNYVFSGCSGLTNVTIPNSVTRIGTGAFSDCSGLTSVTIPNGVMSIESAAFSGCSKLIKTESGVHYVDKWAIDCDSNLNRVTLRSDTVGIGDGVFQENNKLTNVTFPNSVTSIGSWAFYNCNELTKITIKKGVTNIWDCAFAACSKLMSIQFEGTKAEWTAIEKIDNWSNQAGNYTVYCTDGKLDKNGNEVA